ncbi:MAG: alpha/beta hydrolase [Parvularculaceae bacterium]
MLPRSCNTGKISDAARDFLQSLPPFAERPLPPLDGSRAAWRAFQDMIEERTLPACEAARTAYDATIREFAAGGLRALFITPAGANRDAQPALYLHGGGYTTYSARSSLSASIAVAAALERPLVSIDYPLAPASTCHETVSETAAALAALLKLYPGACLIGESAGGGLALSGVNRLRMRGVAPHRLVLISPWTDLGENGESRRTMAALDPILQYEPGLRASAQAYAPGAMNDPDASPIFADYDKAFPPSLILCGSQEILLSDSVRLHEKLNAAGAETDLKISEGMFHSYPILAPDLPESRLALRLVRSFVNRQ